MQQAQKLKLSRCNSLEELTLQCNLELSHVSVSNRSSLKSLKLIDTPLLSEKCFEYLDRALERNGGTREEDSYPYDILDRDGSILYGSRSCSRECE